MVHRGKGSHSDGGELARLGDVDQQLACLLDGTLILAAIQVDLLGTVVEVVRGHEDMLAHELVSQNIVVPNLQYGF